MTVVLVALAALVAGGSVALAALHFARVSGTAVPDPAWIAALRRLPVEERLEQAARRAPEGSWTRRFAIEVRAVESEGARAAAANEALADLAHELEANASWPGAAVRLSCFGALLAAATAFLASRAAVILPLAVIGAAGALIAAELGRRARAVVNERRTAADAFVDVVLPGVVARVSTRGGTFRRARRQ